MRFSALTLILICAFSLVAQSPSYPKELRGYKIERAVVEVKRSEKKPKNNSKDVNKLVAAEADPLIQFGDPVLSSASLMGITFELPIVVSPVKQKGHVDFLVFENMSFNGTAVDVDEYHRPFDLPNEEPLTLSEPLRVYIYLPRAVLAAVDEWNESKKTWVVTGRIYVFGKFKKSVFSFKRCIPMEVKLTMPNPLRKGSDA